MNLARRILRRLHPAPSETIEGYEHPELVETVFRKTVAYRPKAKWTESADAVLDFGGGCGLHYKEANSPVVRWAVVETPAMARRARELETDRLRFFTDIDSAASWLGAVDLMHSNGAIQYAPDPIAAVKHLCGLGAKTMIWRRVRLSKDGARRDTQVSRLLDNGPGWATGHDKMVQYDFTWIPERMFLAAHAGYELLEYEGQNLRFEAIPLSRS